jgi:hypothetical protein
MIIIKIRKASLSAPVYKDFFFTSGFKNVTVLNPGIKVPCEGETGLRLWGPDTVYPLAESYGRIADLICREMERPERRSGKDWKMVSPQQTRGRSSRPRGQDGLISASPRTLFRWGSTTGEVRAEVALEVSVRGGGQVGKAGATTSL